LADASDEPEWLKRLQNAKDNKVFVKAYKAVYGNNDPVWRHMLGLGSEEKPGVQAKAFAKPAS
jgi:hypothetical protein